MKRSLSVLLIMALIAAFGFISCRKQAQESLPQGRGLTVSGARAYFETQVKKLPKTEGADDLPIGEPNWDSAVGKKLNVGEAITVPLKMISTHALRGQVVQGDNYLLVYKEKAGSLRHEVVTVIPASSHENVLKFNGTAIVRDWSGAILRGFNYTDGKYETANITIGSKRGAQAEGAAPCVEGATTVCFPYASGMGYYCFYDVPVSTCGNGGSGGNGPGGGYPGGGIDPDHYPNNGGGPGGGNGSTTVVALNVLSEMTKLNDIIHKGKDPNWRAGKKSGNALIKLPILNMADYIVTFDWDITGPTPKITEITANLSGITFGIVDFNKFSSAVTEVRYIKGLTLEITGELKYTLFVENLGTLYRKPVLLTVTYDATTGDYFIVQTFI